MCCSQKKKKNRFPAYYIRAYRVYAADGKFFSMPAAAAAVGQLQNDVVLVGHRLAQWVMLSFGCVGCCATAVVGHSGCRLTAFEPFKRRTFVVFSYWTVSQHLPLNPIRTLLYMYCHQNWISQIPKPYSLNRRKLYCCYSSSSFFVEPGTFE